MAIPVSPVVPGLNLPERLIGEGQPGVEPLPATYFQELGQLLSRWQLDEEERKRVAETGEVWLIQTTLGRPMQPICITGLRPVQQEVSTNGEPQ